MNNQLFSLYHVAGNEHKLRDFIKDQVKHCCDECYYDNFGNVIVRLAGQGKKIMINTGIDTSGMLITYVEENGTLRFSVIGNLPASALTEKMCICGDEIGVIRAPKNGKPEELKIGDLFIDLGMKSHTIQPGDIFALKNEWFENEEAVFGTNLTVKANVDIMIDVIRDLYEKPRKHDLYFAFTIQDQLGFKGAQVAANTIHPDMAIILSYADCSGEDKLKWDGGSVVKIKDSMMIANRPFREQVTGILTQHQIPLQYEILASGGATNSRIMYLKDGILTFGISLPCRYHASVLEGIRKEELEHLKQATEVLLENL